MAMADVIREYGNAQDVEYWGEHQSSSEGYVEAQEPAVRIGWLGWVKRKLPLLLFALTPVILAGGGLLNSVVLALVFAITLSVIAFFVFLGRDWYFPERPPYGGFFLR